MMNKKTEISNNDPFERWMGSPCGNGKNIHHCTRLSLKGVFVLRGRKVENDE